MQFPSNSLSGAGNSQVQQQPTQQNIQIQTRSSSNQSSGSQQQQQQQQQNFVLTSSLGSLQQQQPTMQMQSGGQPIFLQQSPTQLIGQQNGNQTAAQPQIIQLPFSQFGGQQV